MSQSRSVVGKRIYDAAGSLLRRHFRESFDGTFTNPDTGRVALWTQHDTVLHDLGVPGDLAMGVTKISGSTRISSSSGGTILTEAGVTLLDSATEELIRESAHHPFDDYFVRGDTTALAALCEALS